MQFCNGTGSWKQGAKMTKSEEARAIITGSFILYLADGLLGKSEKFHGTTILLNQLLRAKTKQAQNKEYVIMSNQAWAAVVEKHKDDNYRMAIFDAVEALGFNDEKIMEEMFGPRIIQAIANFALKQTRDGVDNEILKESRIITNELKAATQKVIFDNKDKL